VPTDSVCVVVLLFLVIIVVDDNDYDNFFSTMINMQVLSFFVSNAEKHCLSDITAGT
jgi:hypothetical protein